MEFNWDTSRVILIDRSTLNFSYVSQAAGFSEDLKHLETHGMFDYDICSLFGRHGKSKYDFRLDESEKNIKRIEKISIRYSAWNNHLHLEQV